MTAESTPLAKAHLTPSLALGASAVAMVAQRAQVSAEVVRTFAKVSAPENRAVFSAKAAAKAFAHVKVAS